MQHGSRAQKLLAWRCSDPCRTRAPPGRRRRSSSGWPCSSSSRHMPPACRPSGSSSSSTPPGASPRGPWDHSWGPSSPEREQEQDPGCCPKSALDRLRRPQYPDPHCHLRCHPCTPSITTSSSSTLCTSSSPCRRLCPCSSSSWTGVYPHPHPLPSPPATCWGRGRQPARSQMWQPARAGAAAPRPASRGTGSSWQPCVPPLPRAGQGVLAPGRGYLPRQDLVQLASGLRLHRSRQSLIQLDLLQRQQRRPQGHGHLGRGWWCQCPSSSSRPLQQPPRSARGCAHFVWRWGCCLDRGGCTRWRPLQLPSLQ